MFEERGNGVGPTYPTVDSFNQRVVDLSTEHVHSLTVCIGFRRAEAREYWRRSSFVQRSVAKVKNAPVQEISDKMICSNFIYNAFIMHTYYVKYCVWQQLPENATVFSRKQIRATSHTSQEP